MRNLVRQMQKWFTPREYSFLSEISRQKIKIISAFPEISFYVHILRWFFPREIKRFICVTSILQENQQRLGCKLYQGFTNYVHDEEFIRNFLCGQHESVSHCWWFSLDSYTRKRYVLELHSYIYLIGKKEVGWKWLNFWLWLKFRPTKNYKSFVFYCYYWRLTKFSTDYKLNRLFLRPTGFFTDFLPIR